MGEADAARRRTVVEAIQAIRRAAEGHLRELDGEYAAHARWLQEAAERTARRHREARPRPLDEDDGFTEAASMNEVVHQADPSVSSLMREHWRRQEQAYSAETASDAGASASSEGHGRSQPSRLTRHHSLRDSVLGLVRPPSATRRSLMLSARARRRRRITALGERKRALVGDASSETSDAMDTQQAPELATAAADADVSSAYDFDGAGSGPGRPSLMPVRSRRLSRMSGVQPLKAAAAPPDTSVECVAPGAPQPRPMRTTHKRRAGHMSRVRERNVEGRTVRRRRDSRDTTGAATRQEEETAPAASALDGLSPFSRAKAEGRTPTKYETYCRQCRGTDDGNLMLLCDRCDDCFHTYCCRPPLDAVPEGDWFCQRCVPLAAAPEQAKASAPNVPQRRGRRRATVESGTADAPRPERPRPTRSHRTSADVATAAVAEVDTSRDGPVTTRSAKNGGGDPPAEALANASTDGSAATLRAEHTAPRRSRRDAPAVRPTQASGQSQPSPDAPIDVLSPYSRAIAEGRTPTKYETYCRRCRGGHDAEVLLLCDGCEDSWHTYCCEPRLERVPSGDWFCCHCAEKRRERGEGLSEAAPSVDVSDTATRVNTSPEKPPPPEAVVEPPMDGEADAAPGESPPPSAEAELRSLESPSPATPSRTGSEPVDAPPVEICNAPSPAMQSSSSAGHWQAPTPTGDSRVASPVAASGDAASPEDSFVMLPMPSSSHHSDAWMCTRDSNTPAFADANDDATSEGHASPTETSVASVRAAEQSEELPDACVSGSGEQGSASGVADAPATTTAPEVVETPAPHAANSSPVLESSPAAQPSKTPESPDAQTGAAQEAPVTNRAQTAANAAGDISVAPAPIMIASGSGARRSQSVRVVAASARLPTFAVGRDGRVTAQASAETTSSAGAGGRPTIRLFNRKAPVRAASAAKTSPRNSVMSAAAMPGRGAELPPRPDVAADGGCAGDVEPTTCVAEVEPSEAVEPSAASDWRPPAPAPTPRDGDAVPRNDEAAVESATSERASPQRQMPVSPQPTVPPPTPIATAADARAASPPSPQRQMPVSPQPTVPPPTPIASAADARAASPPSPQRQVPVSPQPTVPPPTPIASAADAPPAPSPTHPTAPDDSKLSALSPDAVVDCQERGSSTVARPKHAELSRITSGDAPMTRLRPAMRAHDTSMTGMAEASPLQPPDSSTTEAQPASPTKEATHPSPPVASTPTVPPRHRPSNDGQAHSPPAAAATAAHPDDTRVEPVRGGSSSVRQESKLARTEALRSQIERLRAKRAAMPTTSTAAAPPPPSPSTGQPAATRPPEAAWSGRSPSPNKSRSRRPRTPLPGDASATQPLRDIRNQVYANESLDTSRAALNVSAQRSPIAEPTKARTAPAGGAENSAVSAAEDAAAAARHREEKRRRIWEHQQRLLHEDERHRQRHAAPEKGMQPATQPGASSVRDYPIPVERRSLSDEDDDEDDDDAPDDGGGDAAARASAKTARIPEWARPYALHEALWKQAPIDPDDIFPRVFTCDLEAVFGDGDAGASSAHPSATKPAALAASTATDAVRHAHHQRHRRHRRSSSGNWVQDRLTWREEAEYKRALGYYPK